jgi:plastocyanin
VLVEALSTGHKIGLGVVGAAFIVFALSCAFLFPRLRSTFPGRGLPAFIIVALVFFFGMLTAVEVFGAEPKEKGETHEAESTTASTQSTNTVAIPPPTTTAATTTTTATKPKSKPKPKPAAKPQTISATETEFKIKLSTTTVKAGPVTIDVKNAGKIQHDLIVNGQGITAGTPRFNGGQTETVKVTLKPGTYDVFCSVPGHKQLGMDAKLTVTA